jgi:hypothetical protein
MPQFGQPATADNSHLPENTPAALRDALNMAQKGPAPVPAN